MTTTEWTIDGLPVITTGRLPVENPADGRVFTTAPA
jgi:hypothetical protein